MYELDDKDTNIDYDFGKSPEDSWWNFKPLSYLDLSSNVITDIPTNISMFEELKTINVRNMLV